MASEMATLDGNEAAAHVAYHMSEVIAIYPITPSSPMGELSDAWSARNIPNIFGEVPSVAEMQSEGGAAGAVHGALQAGALSTTFTASQGLLLMIPNMYKIAGELTAAVFHVAARSVATQALSIFGDHSDVMACRQTGFVFLASGNVQEVMDLALVSHVSTLETRIPFLHFFDGFRTSHELAKVEKIPPTVMRKMVDVEKVVAHRSRALRSDAPVIRGTAQNPDVFFQAREAANPYYDQAPTMIQKTMDEFAKLSGRQYRLFDYVGPADAEQLVVIMGSGAETVEETIAFENKQNKRKLGLLKVRLYRPFSLTHFISAVPNTIKSIAVLDRTKEPGSLGEPLYQDVVTAFAEAQTQGLWKGKALPTIVGGRYGLSSKEFTPGMVKAIYDELTREVPKNHFTIGIKDDLTHHSLEYSHHYSCESDDTFRGIFVGLGADGTVSAAKNSIKIISEQTDSFIQGYFVYDSKKSGSVTKSHLRFGKKPIQSTYLIQKANFIGCHQFTFLDRFEVLEEADEGAVFLLNAPHAHDKVWDNIPREVQQTIIDKKLKFYVIDAYQVAKEAGLGGRINTIMQACFFSISGIISADLATQEIKNSIKKTFGRKGEEIIKRNFDAVDAALSHLKQVDVPHRATSESEIIAWQLENAPEFVRNTTAKIFQGKGDELPVSALPADGTYPVDTAKWEKRGIAHEIPVWDPEVCIQCGKCSIVCPHSVIRIKAYAESSLEGEPSTFKHTAYRGKDQPEGSVYTIQVSPEDCTGCELCAVVCPAKNKQNVGLKALNMRPTEPLRVDEGENWDFFEALPNAHVKDFDSHTVKSTQFLPPYFEFSGACSGCGETPYIKLVTQLFGDRMVVANATGCSSIYGGNLPTTPWTTNEQGLGPAWSNSLFEDNAEFGAGFRLAIDEKTRQARTQLTQQKDFVGAGLAAEILDASQGDESEIYEQRQRVQKLKEKLKTKPSDDSVLLGSVADYLVKKSVWIIGGDGWGYDIGYGGLDHVLASNLNVNILLLDTEVYSNTGGQASKSTPTAAVAKFAATGKSETKKDLGLLAIGYGHVYVARIAMGANDAHTVKAVLEAEHYDGPSLLIAYSPCIAHGYNMKHSLRQSKLAVDSGHWPLYRFNPKLAHVGKNPLTLDSKAPKIPLKDYIYNEARYKILTKIDPERAALLLEKAQTQVRSMRNQYERMAVAFEPGGQK